MKKFVFLVLVLFSFYSFGQFKYKIELDLTFTTTVNSGETFCILNPYSANGRLESQFIEATFSNPNSVRRVKNVVVEYSQQITRFGYQSNISGSSNNCSFPEAFVNFSGSECTDLLSGINPVCVFPNHSNQALQRVFLLEDLGTLNNISAPLKSCESKTINVSSQCGFFYSVFANYNNEDHEILPYADHSGSFNLSMTDLPGLALEQPFQLYVKYTENPTQGSIEISEPLILSYTDCSPQLVQDPPEVIPPRCSNSDDGSINVKFGRPLASNERMLLYVEYLLPNGNWSLFGNSYIKTAADINTVNNNTSNWDSILPPDTYRLRYISKYDSTGNIPPNPNSDEMSLPFDVVAPLPVIFTHTKTNILCKGATDGTITFDSANGGSGTGYQYSIDDGANWQTSSTFSGLAPATYKLRVKDSKNCVSEMTASVTLIEPPLALTVDYDIIKNPSATGVSDGELSIAISGGTGSLTYQWQKNGTNYSTNQNITGLGSGVYKVTVTDANGCTATTNDQTLVDPPSLSITFTVGLIDCNGDKATITAQGQGGFIANGENYTYLWNNGESTKTINVVAGTYTVTVTDSNGATADDTVTLDEPETLTVLENLTPIICNDAANGTIDLAISGGIGTYTIDWQDDVSITSASRTNLIKGEYFYTITDEKGCFTNGSIFISEPLAIEITEGTIVNPTTVGGTDGSITVDVSEGTTPYTYIWTDSNGNQIGTNSNSISGLRDGIYTVTIHDANYTLSAVNLGCESSLEIRLAEPQPLSTTIDETPISCFGETDGQLTAKPIGGETPYTYEWFKDNNGTYETLNTTTKTIGNLGVGKYRVVVTDNANTQVQADYELIQPVEIAIKIVKENIKCYDGNDGAIEITPEGGTAPYTYSWRDNSGIPFSTDKDVSNLHSGSYTVIISDNNGCFTEQSIELTAPTEQLSITLDQLKEPSSATATDGFINVNINGGTLDYTFKWTDNTGTEIATTKNLSNIGEGVYTLTVRDGNADTSTDNSGCIATEDFALLAPDAIVITFDETSPILCNGDSTGEITATANGGFLNFGSDYQYEWKMENNGSFESINQTMTVATNLKAGTYQVVITDDHNVSQTKTYVLTEPIPLDIDLVVTNTVSCSGQDGSISSSVTGDTSPYTYLWNNGAITINISSLGVGNYTLTVTDKNGCEFSQSIELTQPGGMLVGSNVINPSCYGNNDGSIEVTVSNGSPPYTYLWNTNATTPNLTNLISGNYDLTITDNAGCKSIVNFILENPEQLAIDLGEDKELCKGQTYEIDASIEDTGATYQWTSINGFTSTSPFVTLTEDGEYSLTITNANGCQAADTFTLTTTNEVISADFLVPTQAFVGETIVVVDVSHPVPEIVTWEFSQGTTIVSQNGDYAELKFDEKGVYTVTMTTRKGSCQETLVKEIIVQSQTDFGTNQDNNRSFIKEFSIFPNPNNGVFKAKISLKEIAPVSIKIINLTSNVMTNKKIGENQENYIFDYNINMAIGVYLVMLETPKGSQVRKIIVK